MAPREESVPEARNKIDIRPPRIWSKQVPRGLRDIFEPAIAVPKAHKVLTNRAPPFRFFDLPRELRDMIYDYALVEPPMMERQHDKYCPVINKEAAWERPVYRSSWVDIREEAASRKGLFGPRTPADMEMDRYPLTAGKVDTCDRLCKKRQGLNLRRANLQIHKETEDLFWSKNVLCYQSWEEWVHDFLDCGKPAHKWKISAAYWLGGRPCPPRSAKNKVQKLSLVIRQRASASQPSHSDKTNILYALQHLPNLREVELPLPTLSYHLPMLADFRPLRGLHTVTAGLLETVLVGNGTTRLDLHLKHALRMPEGYQALHDKCLTFPSDGSCLSCYIQLRRLCRRLEEWCQPYPAVSDGTDVVARALAKTHIELATSVPVQNADGRPYVLDLRLDGNERELVQVYGLPRLHAAARKKLHKRNEKKKRDKLRKASAKIEAFHRKIMQADQKEREEAPRVKKGSGTATRSSLESRSQRRAHGQSVAARKQKREENRRHEMHRQKSAEKEKDEDMTRSMEEMQLEKKASRKKRTK